MTEDAVLRELRSLKQDIGTMNDRLVHLRYDDFKGAFIEQMRSVLEEEGRRLLGDDMSRIDVGSACRNKAECIGTLRQRLEAVINAMNKDETASAKDLLAGTERLLCGKDSPCNDPTCSTNAAEMLHRMQTLIGVYDKLLEKLVVQATLEVAVKKVPKEMPSVEKERLIAPLSSAWRLDILQLLHTGERSLTDISRSLDMKTGHLQFHMRALREVGYIAVDRHRKAYSITPKGRTAMRTVNELANRLSYA